MASVNFIPSVKSSVETPNDLTNSITNKDKETIKSTNKKGNESTSSLEKIWKAISIISSLFSCLFRKNSNENTNTREDDITRHDETEYQTVLDEDNLIIIVDDKYQYFLKPKRRVTFNVERNINYKPLTEKPLSKKDIQEIQKEQEENIEPLSEEDIQDGIIETQKYKEKIANLKSRKITNSEGHVIIDDKSSQKVKINLSGVVKEVSYKDEEGNTLKYSEGRGRHHDNNLIRIQKSKSGVYNKYRLGRNGSTLYPLGNSITHYKPIIPVHVVENLP